MSEEGWLLAVEEEATSLISCSEEVSLAVNEGVEGGVEGLSAFCGSEFGGGDGVQICEVQKWGFECVEHQIEELFW